MRKHLIALVAFVLLLTPVFALAENNVQNHYTHPDGLYSFQYPDGWTVMDRQYIDSLVSQGTSLEDTDLAQFISQYGSMIEEMDMLMLLYKDGATNVTISYQDTGMPADDAVLLMLSKGVVDQFRTSMPDVTFITEGALVDIGENRCGLIEYTYPTYGIELYGAQVFISGEEKLYSLTYTSLADTADAQAADFADLMTSLQVK